LAKNRLAIYLVALTCIMTACAANPAAPSAAGLYHRAFRTLLRTSRFAIVAYTTYLYQRRYSPTYRSTLRFSAPHGMVVSADLGPTLGVSRQVYANDTYCSWNVGPSFRRIFCQRLPWNESTFSQAVTIHSAPFGLIRPHFSLAPGTSKVTKINVTSRAMISCPPGMFCPQVDGNAQLTGVLTIDARRQCPLLFTALVTDKRASQRLRLSVTYRYDRHLIVHLPKGPRLTCPTWAPPHTWCLSQPGRLLTRPLS
jgi:hypothetical protein